MATRQKIQLNLPPSEVKPVVPRGNGTDNAVVQHLAAEDKTLALKRELLRAAIDESGWKHDAVAAALAVDGPYLSKMLAGEKAITLRHLDALPDDIEAIYSRKYAETMGAIVVAPVEGDAAVRSLVSGLVGLLAPRKVVA